jgi:hypothetical protein
MPRNVKGHEQFGKIPKIQKEFLHEYKTALLVS